MAVSESGICAKEGKGGKLEKYRTQDAMLCYSRRPKKLNNPIERNIWELIQRYIVLPPVIVTPGTDEAESISAPLDS